MMNLRDYLTSNDITQSEFAKLLGVKQPTVSRLLRGDHAPSLNLAFRIEAVTDGQVKAVSWCEAESMTLGDKPKTENPPKTNK